MYSGWSPEQTAFFIDLYKNEEVLYHIKSPEYYNKNARQSAIERIIKELAPIKVGVTDNHIKSKINALRTRFTSELAKQRLKPSGSGTDDTTSSFEFFESLLFLKDHIQARKGELNVSLKNLTNNSAREEEIVVEDTESWVGVVENIELEYVNQNAKVQDIPLSTPSTSDERCGVQDIPLSTPSTSGERCGKRKRNDSGSSDKFLQSAGAALKKLCADNSINDEWHHFGDLVANSIRSLPTKALQLKCKHTIMKAIINSEEEALLL